MKDFLKLLPYKQVLPIYFFIFVTLSFIGDILNYGWFGLKFSLPIMSTTLVIDLFATYKKYKKYKNQWRVH
jgi:hypothetical protein